tara:strand:+ start:574 stop:1632 length:1059 start_codon:yes stop_codon:yes gene_type:complete
MHKRLAVVGAGNAGCISALHFNQYCPDLEIEIYHDSKNTPIERVGQGTVLNVTELIFNTLNLDWVSNKIGATVKTGILYKNWGVINDSFFHRFYRGSEMAMHYTPSKLSELVLNSSKFKVREQKINDPEKEIDSDFIIDCRGRKAIDKNNVNKIINPINAALISSLPKRDILWTESIATANGWTFIVPTENSLSLGYLYNKNITSEEEAIKDFKDSFGVDEIEYKTTFDNYYATNPFVGERTLLNGNQYSFIEPLEATATGLYEWIARAGYGRFIEKFDKKRCTDVIEKKVKEISNFILWHYKIKSKFNSPFWNYASSIPFKGIIEPLGEDEEYGQWSKHSFKIWKENTTVT